MASTKKAPKPVKKPAAKAPKKTKPAAEKPAEKKRRAIGKAFLLPSGIAANAATLRRASDALGVDVPEGSKAPEMVDALRAFYKATQVRDGEPIPLSDDSWVVCKCGELSTFATDFCPFCGDEGEDPEEAAAGEEPGKDVSDRSDNLAVADSSAVVPSDLTAALDASVERIHALERDMMGNGYDLGVTLLDVQRRELWKARGFQSFGAFLTKSVRFGRQTAYGLMDVASKFSREKYVEVGTAKLQLVASVDDPETRDELADEAATLSKREVADRVREAKGKPPKVTPPATPAPTEITLLGKGLGKAKRLGFSALRKDAKGVEQEVALARYEAGAYARYQLSEDVDLVVRLVEGKGGVISGVEVTFRRAE